MKLTVLQENLSKALSIASRFASSRVQLPVLANILLTAEKNKLRVAATNLETSISLSVGAKVKKEGEITVPSKTISDLVGNLTPGQIELQVDKEKMKITSSGFNSVLSGMNASDFPAVPNRSGDGIKLSKDDLAESLSKVLFAVSADETRPVLTGVLTIFKKDGLLLVATDGFRLSQKKLETKIKAKKEEEKLILPKNALTELSRFGSDEDEVDFSFNKKENQAIFGVGESVLTSRIIEGEFPDFERIVPKETKVTVNTDREEMLRAVKLASVFARDAANVVKIHVSKNSFKLSAESSESGSQETEIDAKIEADELAKDGLKMAFNYRFLEEFINSSESDDVEMKFTDSNSPAVFLDTKDPDYLHIVMPVRLQE